MKHLNPSDLDDLARRLQARKREVLNELGAAGTPLQGGVLAGEHEVHSHADDAEAERLDDVRFAEIEVDRNTLIEVEQAQQRLANGLYGLCIDCNEEIPLERLLAQPTAIRCAACQTKTEAKRRH
ncbi:TraR/DksA family transcriptional regulator [Variovorax ginsengisoli]|uniref:TraR/DksA family transcriptional regulator n=1 Tax=Variovorax ginsengisoli TaxID=363844 RepID=A0ABT8S655_9BURK|nr:TraR/DksA family transcriptional regulator [Variovorax ginsengisoli]MDN8615233.1 TraR/DksA family transcriptional regulator [Variovorax ginsengisoli]MDO1534403.1 TraR/DksA family transcriptional regulator [Variovorax ginsengisoli]